MPTKGQILTVPANRTSFEFIETANDTNGARVVVRATVNGKGQFVPNHIHFLQDETFEVISGKLTIWTPEKVMTLLAGEKITLPKNEPHNHYNNHNEAVTYIQTVTPGLDFDYLIETFIGLASDGKMKNGKYGLVQELVILKYLDSKTFLADVPISLQKVLMNIAAPIGRKMGYRAIYKKYSGIEK